MKHLVGLKTAALHAVLIKHKNALRQANCTNIIAEHIFNIHRSVS